MQSKLHYLTSEEETAIKESIPWEHLDFRILDVVRLLNQISGIATVQSCGGHLTPTEDGFEVQSAHVAVKASEEMTHKLLFDILPDLRFIGVEIRYFLDGTFWICPSVHPTEFNKLYTLCRRLVES